MKLAGLSLILLLAWSTALGQHEAVLLDEFGNPTCEDIWARLDSFAFQLNNNVTATGIVAMAGKINDLQANLFLEAMVRGYFRRFRMDDRVTIIRLPLENDKRIAFWLVPEGGTPPSIRGSEWSLTYPLGTKPFIFAEADDYSVSTSVCLPVDGVGLLAKVLEANPGAKTHVILKVRSAKEFRRQRRKIRKELLDYAVADHRIRFFKVIDRRPNPYGIRPTVEYWFVP